MEEVLEGINTGNQCWIRFDVFSGKLMNVNDEGGSNRSRNVNEQNMIIPVGPQPSQPITHQMERGGTSSGTNFKGGIDSTLLTAIITSPKHMLPNNASSLGLTMIPYQKLLKGEATSIQAEEGVPKKRPRNENEMLNQDMQVDEEITATRVAEADIIMQKNPLFDVNIVMAGPAHQACQKK
ncbi:unnamed protein product [Trifolium pratense]|uniref:Uncharacterized protein n=1 Tax=Trifolium pratense TaxID=57577 RepID=A0ACB0IDC8_TRIPR|nr:unnamed protein product [Trifolium pratense]